MRQYLTAALAVLLAAGACGLFAVGFALATAFIFVRLLLERLEDFRHQLRR